MRWTVKHNDVGWHTCQGRMNLRWGGVNSTSNFMETSQYTDSIKCMLSVKYSGHEQEGWTPAPQVGAKNVVQNAVTPMV